MNYKEYLSSDEWKYKREKRILFDKKCQICGRPFDLNVHHMTYKNFPNEQYTDLITVCKNCHIKIEEQKPASYYDSFGIVAKLIAKQFCIDYDEQDISSGGKLDFCNLNTIKKFFYPYLKEHGMTPDHTTGSNIITCHFRNKRYRIILEYIEKNYPINVTFKYTGFSYNMLRKVYENPQRAKELIEEEKF